ncbi:MAG: glucose 1-dehydrogenase [Burkholderiales bacterium]|nr:glucose 1-dehydrogenase [Burkholderiales bacterium]
MSTPTSAQDAAAGSVAAGVPRLPSFRLDGQRALVTGAGRGIGAACAQALAQAGAQVWVAARSATEVHAVAQGIVNEGGQAHALVLDVTDSAAVTKAVQSLGALDILVNSAGTNRPALITDTLDQDLHAVMDLNVHAAFYLAREAARHMIDRGQGGAIITVSSQMGHVGGPKRTVYCASKHAVEGLTKALAWELGPHGIRVNTLCPTFIRTAMTEPMLQDPGFADFVRSRIALGRIGAVEDVMGAVVFLASPAAALITGTALMVDGGWTAA